MSTNMGSMPTTNSVYSTNMQGPTPLPSLPGLPMNQPQPYIPMMPSYTQPPPNVLPPASSIQNSSYGANFTAPQMSVPQPTYNAPVLTSLSLPGMPPITVSASLSATTLEGLSHPPSISQPQMPS